MPSPEAVIRHFTAVLHDGPGRDAVLVAEESGRGVAYLSAGIHHANGGAVGFHRRHGFTDSGISLVRDLRR